jgi:hypothetical protein
VYANETPGRQHIRSKDWARKAVLIGTLAQPRGLNPNNILIQAGISSFSTFKQHLEATLEEFEVSNDRPVIITSDIGAWRKQPWPRG